jgi:hypothetical protein
MVTDRAPRLPGTDPSRRPGAISGGIARISTRGVERLIRASATLAAQVEGLCSVPDVPPSTAMQQLRPAALAVQQELARMGVLTSRAEDRR